MWFSARRRMVEINLFIKKYFTKKRLAATTLLIILYSLSIASPETNNTLQNRRKVELIYADENIIIRDDVTGNEIHHIIGNVKFRMDDNTLTCDSAHYLPGEMQITAFSKAHLTQGDTLDIFSDYMFYNGRNDIAEAKYNVVLIDKETHLYTDAVEYDIKNQVAYYNDRGKIVNNENTLTSIIGIYYVDQNIFHFKDSVKVVNPDYVMTSDTMNYNTETEIVFFTGPTEVFGDSLYMYCEKGWHETKTKITSMWKDAFIDNKKNMIKGDSLFYDDSLGYGQGFRNVVVEDTTNSSFVMGNYMHYIKTPETIFATDSAVFLHVSKDDSLFIHGDTLRSITIQIHDTVNPFRLVKSYYNSRIFSNSLQAKCDSLTLSFQDTIVKLYREPVIWADEHQLTADSMALFIKNKQSDKLELYGSAFVASQIDTLRYNQIKGNSITAYFENNEIYKVDVTENGESIYYLLDGDELIGLDKSKSGSIQIFVENNKVTDVIEDQSPQGVIDPPDPIGQNEPRLDGFIWLEGLKPKDKNDIFRKE